MTEYHVGCGMSGIFAGTVRDYKGGRRIWAKKSDVTDEALGAVAEYLLDNDLEIEFSRDGKEYVLKVEEASSNGGDDDEREPRPVQQIPVLRHVRADDLGDRRRFGGGDQAGHGIGRVHRMRLGHIEGGGGIRPRGFPVKMGRGQARGGRFPMMERRCDRCRCPIPDNVPEGSLRIVGFGFTLNDFTGAVCSNEHYRDGDLCEVCARDLLEWLKGGSMGASGGGCE